MTSDGLDAADSFAPFDTTFSALPGSLEVDKHLSDSSLISSMTTVELVVARAQADAGLIPEESADAMAAVLFKKFPPVDALTDGMSDSATPVPELVSWIRAEVGEPHARFVHVGLTSQDVIDTALSRMQATAIDEELNRLGWQAFSQLAVLAGKYRETPMLARTVGQPAQAITFGYKITQWLTGIEAAYKDLLETRRELAVQIGGPVGDLSGFGPHAHEIVAAVAEVMELHHPRMSWHTERSRVLAAATSYTQTINACAKVAGDVLFMLAPEVGELSLGADPNQAQRGGSSAMPHKRNPAAVVHIRAAATQAPGLLASIAAAGVHEHERAVGPWQAEWRPLRELLHLCGGALTELVMLLQDLIVHPDAMAANLDKADVGGDPSQSAARAFEYLKRFTED